MHSLYHIVCSTSQKYGSSMRGYISVRVSKFLRTLLRNMRRRRKTRSFPSAISVVLLFGVIAVSRNLDLSSLSRTLISFQNQSLGQNSHENAPDVTISRDNSSAESQREIDTSTQKRIEYMKRRVAERRAIHRRIVEKQREQAQSMKSDLLEVGREEASKETEMESGASGAVKGEEGVKNRKEGADDKEVTEQKSEMKEGMEGVPTGARVHGKVAEYGGSLGGTKDGMIRGQNVTRISYTLFKIMKLFGFISMIDSPAGSHAEWMPELVERMCFDHPSFRYMGIDDGEGVGRARKAMGEVVDGEYMVNDVEKMSGNGSDVLFHWTEMDGGERDARNKGYMEHMRKVIAAAKNGDVGYIVFGQFPRLNGPQPTYRKGKWVFEGDEKEDPFLYNEHIRGVVPMGNGRESYMLYMTFYSLRSMPMSQLQV